MKGLAEALGHCSALVWTCDAEGKLTYLNFQNQLPDRPRLGAATLETLLPMVGAQDRQRRARELRCALLDRTSRRHEYVAQWKDGRNVSIVEEISPVWHGPNFQGMVGIGMPLPGSRETSPPEDDLTLVGALNHEARNCLTGILGTLQLLQEGDSETDQSERLAAAQQSCETLLGLLQDSLDTHKLRMGGTRLKKTHFSPAERARALLTSLEKMARECGAKLQLSTAGETPSTVVGDPYRLGQILTNLLTNALKYSRGGTVTLSVAKAGAGLCFQVQDDGPGIDTEFQKVMFGAYQQEHENLAGWGLGLGISQTLARLMGGRLECQSSPQGTTFSLWLPLVASRPPAFASQRGKPKACPTDLQALIVEDQPLVAQALAGQLGKLGVVSRVAQNGEQALHEMEARMPELVFLDLHLSDGNGFTVCREIRRRHGRDPVVVGLTGDTAKGIRRRCLESGMDECIFKPMSLSRLSELLQQVHVPESPQKATKDSYASVHR